MIIVDDDDDDDDGRGGIYDGGELSGGARRGACPPSPHPELSIRKMRNRRIIHQK